MGVLGAVDAAVDWGDGRLIRAVLARLGNRGYKKPHPTTYPLSYHPLLMLHRVMISYNHP
jgi:hypothetical protein